MDERSAKQDHNSYVGDDTGGVMYHGEIWHDALPKTCHDDIGGVMCHGEILSQLGFTLPVGRSGMANNWVQDNKGPIYLCYVHNHMDLNLGGDSIKKNKTLDINLWIQL